MLGTQMQIWNHASPPRLWSSKGDVPAECGGFTHGGGGGSLRRTLMSRALKGKKLHKYLLGILEDLEENFSRPRSENNSMKVSYPWQDMTGRQSKDNSSVRQAEATKFKGTLHVQGWPEACSDNTHLHSLRVNANWTPPPSTSQHILILALMCGRIWVCQQSLCTNGAMPQSSTHLLP